MSTFTDKSHNIICGIMRCCVLEHKRPMILEEAHDGIVGGHYVGRENTHKILCAWIWWHKLHKDAKEYCHAMYAKEWEIHLGGTNCL
jgi:hypothetical protein